MSVLVPSASLDTPCLSLWRPSAGDGPELRALHQDPRVMATLGGAALSDAQCEAYLDRVIDHWDRHGFGWWIARGRLYGDFVGRGGLRRATIDGEDVLELGYAVRSELWGRGLASEIAEASLRVAFERLKAPSVVAWTLPSNAASRRVMEASGLRLEKTISWAGAPHVLYRITAADWRARSNE